MRDKILKAYLKVCVAAASDDGAFKTFKSHPAYREVLEHLSPRLGLAHWVNIRHDYFTKEAMAKFLQNDRYGNSKIARFGGIIASPTTIQYISVLSNLITKFGSLQGMRIIEIGGGYGGQAKIIQDMFSVANYDIVDLYECNLLQEKYLTKLNCISRMGLFSSENYHTDLKYDLFISNYALTEITPIDQLNYVKDICLNCKHGYITANQPLHGLDLLKEKYEVRFEKDIEGERETNQLITW